MKGIFCHSTILVMLLTLPVTAASAQTLHSERLLVPGSNSLLRDLGRSPSQDFFNEGQKNLEREVQLLTQRQQFLAKDLLRIDPNLRIPPDLSQFELPKPASKPPEFAPPAQ